MPIPRQVAVANRLVFNRLTRPLLKYLPGFAVVIHRGRRSGASYRTPVNIFRSGDRVRIALTYGTESDWVRNVVAAGGGSMITRGRVVALAEPIVSHDPARTGIPRVPRTILGWLHVDDFVDAKVEPIAGARRR